MIFTRLTSAADVSGWAGASVRVDAVDTRRTVHACVTCTVVDFDGRTPGKVFGSVDNNYIMCVVTNYNVNAINKYSIICC